MSEESVSAKKETKCLICGRLSSVCRCDEVDLGAVAFRAFLSVETRGGTDDVVTLIEKLPPSEPFLKTFLRKLVSDCQLRGTYRIDRKQGIVEFSGDKRIRLRKFFTEANLSFVG